MSSTATTWITLTAADLTDARAASLVEAVRLKVRDPGQRDPLAGLIDSVISELRGCIGFKSHAKLSATAGTIPPNLSLLAKEKICRVMKGRIAMALTDAEKEDERSYQSRLAALRDGEWPVDLPTDPMDSTAQTGTPSPSIKKTHREFSRRHQDGL